MARPMLLWWMMLTCVLVATNSHAAADASAQQPRRTQLHWATHAGSARVAAPAALMGLYRRCGAPHAGLIKVARGVGRRLANGAAPPAGAELSQLVRAAGVPHLSARVWAASGAMDGQRLDRLEQWLGADRPRQCGVVQRGVGERRILTLVTVDALASMQPLPMQTEAYRWQQLDAQALVPIAGARVVLLGPHGPPHRVPASVAQGRVRARFRLDKPGRWLVQLVGDLPDGPRPLLSVEVYVDAEPPTQLGSANAYAPRTLNQLLADINAERRYAGRMPLRHDPRLSRVASQHAVQMGQRGRVAHDVGSGAPDRRADAAGFDGGRVGENVARARSIAGLLSAWWDSPSHRENLLDSRFVRVGLGAAEDASGRYYGALLLLR